MSATQSKVVAITGASSGIGEATALLLAERGAKVILGARGSEKLAALVDRIVGSGGDAAYVPTDVRSREDLSALVALARERHGKLDVLINNAGVMPISPLDELRVDDWDEMIDVNIKGLLYGIAAALPVSHSRLRAIRQYRVYGWLQNGPQSVGVFRDKVRSSRDFGRFAPGGGRSRACDDHLPRLRRNQLCRAHYESVGESPTREVS